MTAKRKIFHALLANMHMLDAKEHLLERYDATSTMDLTELQLDELIEYLRQLNTTKTTNQADIIKHWRSKCLRVMSGIIDTSDWNKVNNFMMDKRIAGVHLYEINTVEDLQKLHKKLNKIKDIYKAKDAVVKYKAALN